MAVGTMDSASKDKHRRCEEQHQYRRATYSPGHVIPRPIKSPRKFK